MLPPPRRGGCATVRLRVGETAAAAAAAAALMITAVMKRHLLDDHSPMIGAGRVAAAWSTT
jgi:hypothetical protein